MIHTLCKDQDRRKLCIDTLCKYVLCCKGQCTVMDCVCQLYKCVGVCVCVCVHACVLFMCFLTKDYVCNSYFLSAFIPYSVRAHGLSQSNSILLLVG